MKSIETRFKQKLTAFSVIFLLASAFVVALAGLAIYQYVRVDAAVFRITAAVTDFLSVLPTFALLCAVCVLRIRDTDCRDFELGQIFLSLVLFCSMFFSAFSGMVNVQRLLILGPEELEYSGMLFCTLFFAALLLYYKKQCGKTVVLLLALAFLIMEAAFLIHENVLVNTWYFYAEFAKIVTVLFYSITVIWLGNPDILLNGRTQAITVRLELENII